MVDVANDDFSTISIASVAGYYKYNGAAAVGDRVFFAPSNADEIGVLDVATVPPHVNMLKFHAGMGPDPAGLLTATAAAGALVQAYEPLGGGDASLFGEPVVVAAAAAHNKSAAQVLLKWVAQVGEHALVTATTDTEYMRQDLDLFDWALSADEMAALNSLGGHDDDPTGEFCVL